MKNEKPGLDIAFTGADPGISKYHFKLGAGRENFVWEQLLSISSCQKLKNELNEKGESAMALLFVLSKRNKEDRNIRKRKPGGYVRHLWFRLNSL